MSSFGSFSTYRLLYQITLNSQPFADTRSSAYVSNGTVGATDTTLHVWDTSGKHPSLSGTPCAGNGSSSMGASAGSVDVDIDIRYAAEGLVQLRGYTKDGKRKLPTPKYMSFDGFFR